jgi:hypothetical protein
LKNTKNGMFISIFIIFFCALSIIGWYNSYVDVAIFMELLTNICMLAGFIMLRLLRYSSILIRGFHSPFGISAAVFTIIMFFFVFLYQY